MSGKPEEIDIQKIAQVFAEKVGNVISESKSTWKEAREPFNTSIKETEHKYRDYVSQPKTVKAQKKFMVIKTGTFLDKLFVDKNGKPYNGIPIVAQVGLVGLPDSGKSIFIQEVALRLANEGKKVVFITSEDIWEAKSPRYDLQSRMIEKAQFLGYDWEKIRENILVLDTQDKTMLRDWKELIHTYRYLVENVGVDFLIIDSITLLDTYRGALKNHVSELSSYNQDRGVTTIYVCQRSEEDYNKYKMAGGIGIAHNLDINICLDMGKATGDLKDDVNNARLEKGLTEGKTEKDMTKEGAFLKQWDAIRFIRVMGCRLCNFDGKHYEVTISKTGFLEAPCVK